MSEMSSAVADLKPRTLKKIQDFQSKSVRNGNGLVQLLGHSYVITYQEYVYNSIITFRQNWWMEY